MVLTMVGRGLGMAILPELSLREATDAVEIAGLGLRAGEARGIRHHTGIGVHSRCQGSDQGTQGRKGLKTESLGGAFRGFGRLR